MLVQTGVEQTILVQAAPSTEETDHCLALAHECDFVKGVVGWIDFEAEDAVDRLRWLASDPLFKGLRPMVQSIAEPGWLLRSDFAPIYTELIAWGLSLDGLIRADQISDLDSLAQHYPDLAIVLDHAGKPPIASGTFTDWAQAITNLARNPNVHCKLSGLWAEAGADHAIGKIQRYVDHVLAAFGPERLMWGSDWPVVNLAGSYGDWLADCHVMLSTLDENQKAAIFGGNGARFYAID